MKPSAEEKVKAVSSRTVRTVSIVGTGAYVPEQIMTNEDLTKIVETTDEWITTRTGIRERRIAAKDQPTSDLAARAAQAAFATSVQSMRTALLASDNISSRRHHSASTAPSGRTSLRCWAHACP